MSLVKYVDEMGKLHRKENLQHTENQQSILPKFKEGTFKYFLNRFC